MKDFFISYTKQDVNAATWIAELLESNGYNVIIQEWDFRPGDDFVSKINESLIGCRKLILVLSSNYLKSKWCEKEWTAKLVEQMSVGTGRIIPIKIENMELFGLLAPIIYIDIVDKTEAESVQLILNGIKETVPRISSGYPSFYNIEYISIDIDYYVSDAEIVLIKKLKFKVLVDNLNKVHNRVTWFKNEEVTLTAMTQGTRIENLDLKDTNMNHNIIFDQMFEKNEVYVVQIKAILTNKHKQFDNFFSSEIIATVKQLNIHLHLKVTEPKKYYTQKICSSPFNIRSEAPQTHMYQPPIHWNISNPELHFEYKIWW